MGYETRLIIGRSGYVSDQMARGEEVFKDGELLRPYLIGDDGDYIKTGKKVSYFQVYAEIDLCKMGSGSAIHSLDRVNKDEGHFWEWYGSGDGNKEITEDAYGEKLKPVPICDVIKALEADAEDSLYRRIFWALSLLKIMAEDPQKIEVLVYGH